MARAPKQPAAPVVPSRKPESSCMQRRRRRWVRRAPGPRSRQFTRCCCAADAADAAELLRLSVRPSPSLPPPHHMAQRAGAQTRSPVSAHVHRTRPRPNIIFFLKKKSSNNRPAPERDLRAWRRDERRRTKGAVRHGPRLSRLDRDREGPCARRRRCRWPRDARARAPNPAAFLLLLLLCPSLGACALSLKCSA